MSEVPLLGGHLEGQSPADTAHATSAPEDEGLADASALSRAGLSEDMGELDFTYDDTLLQADEEEEAALSEAPHTDSQEPESDRSKQEQFDRWEPSSASALPVQTNDVPAHSMASNNDHADRQRLYERQRAQRPGIPNRGDLHNRDYPQRGRGHMQMQGPGSRHPDAHRGPPPPSGVRNQGAADRPSSSSQYGRPAPPSGKPPEEAMEFDPNILWKAMGITPSAMPPSFAPVSDDASHNKRSHNSMQNQMPSIPEDLMRSLLQMRQGQHPNGPGNMPHQGIRPGVPPPRPPAGPPPDGPPPKHHNRHPGMMQGFGGVPDFSPMTSNAMDYQGFAPQQQMPRPGQPGWSLSHGMDGGGRGSQSMSGAGRASTSQEPTLAAGMVWDDVHAAPSFSGRDQPHVQADHFRQQVPGPRGGYSRPMPPQGPRPPPAKSPPLAQAKPSQDALAAAKAKFEQQQKENERIAEMNKRQRLGLPMERKPTQETEIDRLKRQIAEKEAAVKAAQAQMPAPKSGPSAFRSRPSSASPNPASPQDLNSPNSKPQQSRSHSAAVRAEHAEAAERAEPSNRGRGTEASPSHGRSPGHRRHSRERSQDRSREKIRGKSRERSRREDKTERNTREEGRPSHARQNGSSSSHHRGHESRQRDRSRDRSDRRSNREQKEPESYRSPHRSTAQASQQSHSQSPMSERQRARHSSDAGRNR